MAQLPFLLGDQVIFAPSWESPAPQIILDGSEIREYRKILFPPALPTYEIGPLGQVAQRQLNYFTPPYRFEWEFMITDDKKEQLEGLTTQQQLRYSKNNSRTDVHIVYDDERWATLELLEHARKVRLPANRFDTAPTAHSHWQFSQFNVKIESFTQERLNRDLWIVLMTGIESNLDTEDIS